MNRSSCWCADNCERHFESRHRYSTCNVLSDISLYFIQKITPVYRQLTGVSCRAVRYKKRPWGQTSIFSPANCVCFRNLGSETWFFLKQDTEGKDGLISDVAMDCENTIHVLYQRSRLCVVCFWIWSWASICLWIFYQSIHLCRIAIKSVFISLIVNFILNFSYLYISYLP